MWALESLDKFKRLGLGKVLDIGSGEGEHADAMRDAGMDVVTVSLCPPANLVCDYMELSLDPVDGIWASHVLEHILNVDDFLQKCFHDLKPGGYLAVTVPPAKYELVGGHVSLWTEGLLLYRLILAGFDCSKAMVGVYGYNISVIVQKQESILPPLAMDCGDIERLKHFFPCAMTEGMDGRLGNINWN